ncbi:MAG: hypothetical protein ACXWNK_16230 [Vulcanimicrobiaceae bacterium]
MAQRSENYKDHAIVVDDTANPPLVTIDGRPIVVFRRAGLWFTTRLAFNDFQTLENLTHAVIDHGLAPK